MRKTISTILSGAMLATTFIVPAAPAVAQSWEREYGLFGNDDDDWRWRHRRGGNWDRHGDWDRDRDRRHARHRDRHHDRDWDDDNDNEVVAGIAGFAAGALVGSLAANSGGSHVARCEARFQSYDRYSDTYLGYDGYRHQCTL